MFRRIVLSALLAGLVAGLALTLLQRLQVLPLIVEAETYELAEPAGAPVHADGLSHEHDARGWAPADGIERTAYTALANVLTAVGFGLLLGAAFALREPVDALRGLLWGAAGYAVFFLAPSLGLPPEIPGAAAAALEARQFWWLLTVGCTAAGLALIALQPRWPLKILGAAVLVLPHVGGAPQPGSHGGVAPQELAQSFVLATAIANAAFWLLLGALNGFFFRRFRRV